MSTYAATVHRDGDWHVVVVDGVGITQTRHRELVVPVATDLIRWMAGDPEPLIDPLIDSEE